MTYDTLGLQVLTGRVLVEVGACGETEVVQSRVRVDPDGAAKSDKRPRGMSLFTLMLGLRIKQRNVLTLSFPTVNTQVASWVT